MILIIDNYDSFTYNLYQYVGEITNDIRVFRNDSVTVDEIREMGPSHIIISPGPGFPAAAGISVQAIRELGNSIPILGVCLGHQAIAEAFGGKVVHAARPVHGIASEIELSADCELFYSMPERIMAGRYHSLLVQEESLPVELKVTARTPEGEIMGLKHTNHPVFGIQFHPESILTPLGSRILENFLDIKP